MNLFDDMIKDILAQLNQLAAMENAGLEKPSRAWKDVGEHHMILGKEMAYELGGQNTLGLSGCLYTTKPMLFKIISVFGILVRCIWKDIRRFRR